MLFGNLQGHYELSTSFFDGEVQIEKAIMPSGIAFSGILDLAYFVVSTNNDSKPFLTDNPYEAGRRRGAAAPFNSGPTPSTGLLDNDQLTIRKSPARGQ